MIINGESRELENSKNESISTELLRFPTSSLPPILDGKFNLQYFQDLFNRWNIEKFENKLPQYNIQFWKLRGSYGKCNYRKKWIKLSSELFIPSEAGVHSAENTLLHEMVHADLCRRGCRNKGHTKKFWRLLVAKGGNIRENTHMKRAQAVMNERLEK